MSCGWIEASGLKQPITITQYKMCVCYSIERLWMALQPKNNCYCNGMELYAGVMWIPLDSNMHRCIRSGHYYSCGRNHLKTTKQFSLPAIVLIESVSKHFSLIDLFTMQQHFHWTKAALNEYTSAFIVWNALFIYSKFDANWK